MAASDCADSGENEIAKRRAFYDYEAISRTEMECDMEQPNGSIKWNSSRQLINEDIHKMINDGADVQQMLKSWTRYA
jgi:multiple sugar transport system substrate-binding protein